MVSDCSAFEIGNVETPFSILMKVSVMFCIEGFQAKTTVSLP